MRKTTLTTKRKTQAEPTVELLTNATWNFAHSVLWNGYPFSESTVAICKKYIREYYDCIPKERTRFSHFYFSRYCQRIVLAKAYVNRFPGRYIPHPTIWLNRKNPKGFAGTKLWLARILEKRKTANLALKSGVLQEAMMMKAHKNFITSN
jgi:hypothetical protein